MGTDQIFPVQFTNPNQPIFELVHELVQGKLLLTAPRRFQLTGHLELTLLYLPTRFGEEWTLGDPSYRILHKLLPNNAWVQERMELTLVK